MCPNVWLVLYIFILSQYLFMVYVGLKAHIRRPCKWNPVSLLTRCWSSMDHLYHAWHTQDLTPLGTTDYSWPISNIVRSWLLINRPMCSKQVRSQTFVIHFLHKKLEWTTRGLGAETFECLSPSEKCLSGENVLLVVWCPQHLWTNWNRQSDSAWPEWKEGAQTMANVCPWTVGHWIDLQIYYNEFLSSYLFAWDDDEGQMGCPLAERGCVMLCDQGLGLSRCFHVTYGRSECMAHAMMTSPSAQT